MAGEKPACFFTEHGNRPRSRNHGTQCHIQKKKSQCQPSPIKNIHSGITVNGRVTAQKVALACGLLWPIMQ